MFVFKCKFSEALTKNQVPTDEEIEKYSKLQEMKQEEIGMKEYLKEMKLEEARTLFKFRSKMMEAKFNFKHKTEYTQENWMCDSCESMIDSNLHVTWCSSYQHLREGKNLNSEKDLVQYLQKVMEIRTKLRLNR